MYRSMLKSFPPKLIFLGVGNCLISYILQLIKSNVQNIKDYSVLFSSTDEEFKYMAKQLEDMGFISSEDTAGVMTSIYVQAKGWKRISELSGTTIGSKNQAFVAMRFSDKTEAIYEKVIKPAIDHDGVIKALRIDCLEHNNKICDQIIVEIRSSKYLVSDFTGNRGGVYYEAGFAHGLGLPVIWCVKEEEIDCLPFDTRQYNHIPYHNTKDLYKKSLNRIKATFLAVFRTIRNFAKRLIECLRNGLPHLDRPPL